MQLSFLRYPSIYTIIGADLSDVSARDAPPWRRPGFFTVGHPVVEREREVSFYIRDINRNTLLSTQADMFVCFFSCFVVADDGALHDSEIHVDSSQATSVFKRFDEETYFIFFLFFFVSLAEVTRLRRSSSRKLELLLKGAFKHFLTSDTTRIARRRV